MIFSRRTMGGFSFFAGLLGVLGPLFYLMSEAIAARAWSAGAYDYGVNFISDLGATVCGSEFDGRVMCSPLHAVMNSGYVVIGVSLGILFTALAMRSGRGRVLASLFGWVIAVGMICVAAFPGEAKTLDEGNILFHVIGAAVAIFAANALFISVGIRGQRLSLPSWLRVTTVAFGVLGIVGFVLTLAPQQLAEPAIFERIAVYSIFASSIATGITLMVNGRRDARSTTPISAE